MPRRRVRVVGRRKIPDARFLEPAAVGAVASLAPLGALRLVANPHERRLGLEVAVPGAAPAEVGDAAHQAGTGDSIAYQGRADHGVGAPDETPRSAKTFDAGMVGKGRDVRRPVLAAASKLGEDWP